jgi:hypothetical protein
MVLDFFDDLNWAARLRRDDHELAGDLRPSPVGLVGRQHGRLRCHAGRGGRHPGRLGLKLAAQTTTAAATYAT